MSNLLDKIRQVTDPAKTWEQTADNCATMLGECAELMKLIKKDIDTICEDYKKQLIDKSITELLNK